MANEQRVERDAKGVLRNTGLVYGARVSRGWGVLVRPYSNPRAYGPLDSTHRDPGWKLPGGVGRLPCRTLPQWGRARSHGRKSRVLPPPGDESP